MWYYITTYYFIPNRTDVDLTGNPQMLCIKYKINLWEYFKVINDYTCKCNSI